MRVAAAARIVVPLSSSLAARAYAVLQKPSILLSLALSELYSSHPLDAIVHFEEYMKDPSTPGDKRETAKKHLEEAMKKTSHLQIRTPAEAQVTIDGQSIPPPYTMVHVMPGAHAVEARLASKTKSATIAPKPGDTVPIDLTFEGEPTPPPIAPPPDPTATNNPTSATNANPPTATEPSPSTPAPSTWSTMKTLAVVSWVGAVGAGVAGGLLLGSSAHKADEGRRATEGVPTCVGVSSPQCDTGRDAAATSADLKTAGIVAIVGAGALAVTGFVLFLWPKRGPTASAASRSAIVVQPSGLGLVHRF
jgi:hypothetical protein